MNKHYGHSGDLGDIIFALPTIRAMGGGTLHLYTGKGTNAPMTEGRFSALKPLLTAQPYIKDVILESGPKKEWYDLNAFRTELRKPIPLRGHMNLAEAHLACMHQPLALANEAWLIADYFGWNKFVFARSFRYHNDRFPWAKIVERWGRDAVFIGTREEHIDFICSFGAVEYRPTADLLVVAGLIQYCELFIGNQSAPEAIAEGLKKDIILETAPTSIHSCWFQRRGLLMGIDEGLGL